MLRSFRKHLRKKFYKIAPSEVKHGPKHQICKAVWLQMNNEEFPTQFMNQESIDMLVLLLLPSSSKIH